MSGMINAYWNQQQHEKEVLLEAMKKELERERMLDIANNPFIDWSEAPRAEQRTWQTDDVAHSRAMKKLKFKVTFYQMALDEIAKGEVAYNQEVVDLCKAKLALWKGRLHQAIYN